MQGSSHIQRKRLDTKDRRSKRLIICAQIGGLSGKVSRRLTRNGLMVARAPIEKFRSRHGCRTIERWTVERRTVGR